MIRVLIIEDDPMVQEVNRQFIDMVEGFQIVGMASNGIDGLEKIEKLKPDLVLIDVFMPQQDGLMTLQKIKQQGVPIDIIAITAASDVDTVKTFIQQGAFDYIMKPFRFERIKKALDNYRIYHKKFHLKQTISQEELDGFLFQHTEVKMNELPKGFNPLTLEKILMLLEGQKEGLSAEEVAENVGIARVTARRYLDHLEKVNKVELDIEYRGIGRPVNRYRLLKGK
jgi:two-component system response regulator DctR